MRTVQLLILSTLFVFASYVRQPAAHVTDEPFRSVYHHTPQSGWMNDPNGMFYDQATGDWHLYYQHYPDGTTWGPMHWGHSVSKDLIHWEHLPIAIYPDSIGMIFSGSAVVDRENTAGFGENAIIAIYTSAAEHQTQSIAYSLDGGVTFTPYEGNPVLTDPIPDFRDPKVFRDELTGKWVMTLACQQEIRFYGSDDLKHWELLSRFGEGYGNHGGVWECPDLLNFGSHWVLLVNINPGGPFGGSATQYFIGNWDGKTFTCIDDPEEQKWLDFGKDHYATVTWNYAPDGRIVAIGWMSNWQYANVVPTVAFRSQNTIARDLSLYTDDNGEIRVAVVPSKENDALRGKQINCPADACIIDIEIPVDDKNAVIMLANDANEQVVMTYDFAEQTFTMDRTKAGDNSFSEEFAAETSVLLFNTRDTYHLTLYIDHCSVEAFDGEGAWAMTNLVFPSKPYDKLTVEGGKATIYAVK